MVRPAVQEGDKDGKDKNDCCAGNELSDPPPLDESILYRYCLFHCLLSLSPLQVERQKGEGRKD